MNYKFTGRRRIYLSQLEAKLQHFATIEGGYRGCTAAPVSRVRILRSQIIFSRFLCQLFGYFKE